MKVKRRLKPKIKLSFYIVIALIMIFFGFYLQRDKVIIKDKPKEEIKKEVKKEKETYENPFPALRNLYQNNDIVGEVSIPTINLKELVVRTTDNDFYLNHDIKKEENVNGSIFIDYRISDIDNAKQVNIYGHNSTQDSTIPFKVLENYQDENFFKNNLQIILKTDKNIYNYEIFSVSIVPKSDNEHMIISYEGNLFLEHLALMRSKALFDTNIKVNSKDNILVIQTCLFNPENFLLIMAKKMS